MIDYPSAQWIRMNKLKKHGLGIPTSHDGGWG